MKLWQQYQEDAAAFFRAIGLTAIVDETIVGLRGSHDIDVYVIGSLHGVHFKWIVECKAWRTNIPKEKVMALASIVEDVGADRGFLLSEVGFQSGAVQQASKRNITLSSLSDLRDAASETATEQTLAHLAWRAKAVEEEIRRRYYEGGRYLKEFMPPDHWYHLNALSLAFDDARNLRYPLVYLSDSRRKIERAANNIEELISGVHDLVFAAEHFLETEYPDLPLDSNTK